MKKNTLAKKIREAKDYDEASQLAEIDKVLSPFTLCARRYLDSFKRYKLTGHTWRPEEKAFLGTVCGRLCEMFLDCIENGKPDLLRELADTLDNPAPAARDNARGLILVLKDILDAKNERQTLNWLAERLTTFKVWSGAPEQLRRLAKELKFPLIKDRVGRPRKRETRNSPRRPSKS